MLKALQIIFSTLFILIVYQVDFDKIGSICAQNMCDLYLGKLENSLFYYAENSSLNIESLFSKSISSNSRMQLCRANEIILRIVDDYLVLGSDISED